MPKKKNANKSSKLSIVALFYTVLPKNRTGPKIRPAVAKNRIGLKISGAAETSPNKVAVHEHCISFVCLSVSPIRAWLSSKFCVTTVIDHRDQNNVKCFMKTKNVEIISILPTPTQSVSMGRIFESVCLSVCLFVCLFVRSITQKNGRSQSVQTWYSE